MYRSIITFNCNNVSEWIKKPIADQLNDVYTYTLDCVTQELSWYHAKSASCKRITLTLRTLCVLAVIVSTLLPLLSSPPFNTLGISPIYTTIALILAGGLYTFDKVMGYSDTWTRMMSTKIKITSDIESFNIQWAESLTQAGGTIDAEQATAMIENCKTLVNSINSSIMNETSQWISDFNANTQLLEDMITKGNAKEEVVPANTVAPAPVSPPIAPPTETPPSN